MNRRKSSVHPNEPHQFIGVPVAWCYIEGCDETRTWGPPITPTHPFSQIGGGAVWYSTQLGDTGPTDPGMGPYADEGELDPAGTIC